MSIPTPITGTDVRMYLKAAMPPLSREVEHELVSRAQARDRRAEDILLRSNIRMIVNVAKRYRTYKTPLTDLVSEGSIGFRVGLMRFNNDSGLKLMSYAIWWVRQRIQRYQMLGDEDVKASNDVRRLQRIHARKANETYNKLWSKRRLQEHDIDFLLSDDVTYALQGVSDELYEDFSLDAPMPTEDSSGTKHDYVSAALQHEAPDNDYDFDIALIRPLLESALPERELDVFCRTYGLLGKVAMTMDEIGSIYGICRERVRQLLTQACSRLEKECRSRGIANASNLYGNLREWYR